MNKRLLDAVREKLSKRFVGLSFMRYVPGDVVVYRGIAILGLISIDCFVYSDYLISRFPHLPTDINLDINDPDYLDTIYELLEGIMIMTDAK